MKKTNFVVIFWLLLALLTFTIAMFNLSSIFSSLSYLIFPMTENEGYYNVGLDMKRTLVSNLPILLINALTFFYSVKTGMKTYNKQEAIDR